MANNRRFLAYEAQVLPPYYGNMDHVIAQDPNNDPLPGTWFYNTDHIGSSKVVTNGRGKEATRFQYLPFGELDLAHSSLDRSCLRVWILADELALI